MRWWLLVASLSMMVVLTIPDAQAGGRHLNLDGESHKEKRKRDRTGHGRSRGPRPLKIRLVPGANIPMELMEKQRLNGSVNKRNIQEQQLTYSVIPGKLRPCVPGTDRVLPYSLGSNSCVSEREDN